MGLRMIQKAFLIFFVVLSFPAYGEEVILSGRPGVAIPAQVLEPGFLQLQSGLYYYSLQSKAQGDSETRLMNHFLRFGVVDRVEVNLLSNYQLQDGDLSSASSEGFSALSLGGRYLVRVGQSSWVRSMALQAELSLNQVSSEYRADQDAFGLTIASEHRLFQRSLLTINLGGIQGGGQASDSYFYRVAVNHPLTGQTEGFVEVYGGEQGGDWDTSFDFGISRLTTPDMVFDLSMGYGRNDGVTELFLSAGISLRAQIFGY